MHLFGTRVRDADTIAALRGDAGFETGLFLADGGRRVRWTLNGQVKAEIDIGDYFAGVDDAFVTVMAMGGHQHNRWTYSEMSILTSPDSPRMNPTAGGAGPSVPYQRRLRHIAGALAPLPGSSASEDMVLSAADAAEIQEYERHGVAALAELSPPPAGPLTFGPDGRLPPVVGEALEAHGFYVFDS